MFRLGSLGGRDNGGGQARFKAQLENVMRSVTPGQPIDPTGLDVMVAMVRNKEVSAGDALSCFKTYFRSTLPEEQYHVLLVLQAFVNADPAVGTLLHTELATKRWKERFVALGRSCPHPAAMPQLTSMLTVWAGAYHAHDIGLQYTNTLKELAAPGNGRAGSPYSPQYTGASTYSSQPTGYSVQNTGYGRPPPPAPAGYPAGGYPGAYPPPHPAPYPAPYGAPPRGAPGPGGGARQSESGTVSSKLDKLTSEVEALRACIRALEGALSDYKAGRAPFSALSAALERGQRTADKCAAVQTQLETQLGSSADVTDEALLARVFAQNDAAVSALATWRTLANQELAPDDAAVDGAAATAAAAPAGASPAAAAPAPPPPPKPAPNDLDLLLGDELPPPALTPTAAAVVAAPPPAAFANGGAASTSAGPAAAVAAEVPAAAIVPATTMEGLREQVLSLAAELEAQRRRHATALETQEAFHRQEVAQAKARIMELEARLQQQQQQQYPGGAAAGGAHTAYGAPAPYAAPYGTFAQPYSAAPAPTPAHAGPTGGFPVMVSMPPAPAPGPAASTTTNPFTSFGSAPAAAPAAPPPLPYNLFAAPAQTPQPPPPAPGPSAAPLPYNAFAPAPAAAEAATSAPAAAAGAKSAAAPDAILSGFDELAMGSAAKQAPAPSASFASPPPPPPPASVVAVPVPAAAPGAPPVGAAAAGPTGGWVDF